MPLCLRTDVPYCSTKERTLGWMRVCSRMYVCMHVCGRDRQEEPKHIIRKKKSHQIRKTSMVGLKLILWESLAFQMSSSMHSNPTQAPVKPLKKPNKWSLWMSREGTGTAFRNSSLLLGYETSALWNHIHYVVNYVFEGCSWGGVVKECLSRQGRARPWEAHSTDPKDPPISSINGMPLKPTSYH